MAGSRVRLAAVVAIGLAGAAAAEPSAPGRPRVIVGTRIVDDGPAAPIVLTIPPRDVTEAPVPPPPTRLPLGLEDLIRMDAPRVTPAVVYVEAPPAPRFEPVRESPTAIVHQAAPVPVPVSVAVPEATPDLAGMVLRQTLAAMGAVTVVLFALVVTLVLVLRRHATALLQVQVVGQPVHPGPFPPAAGAVVTYSAPEPNFVLGPSYDEDARMGQEAADRQAAAVLERIADENVALLAELESAPAS